MEQLHSRLKISELINHERTAFIYKDSIENLRCWFAELNTKTCMLVHIVARLLVEG